MKVKFFFNSSPSLNIVLLAVFASNFSPIHFQRFLIQVIAPGTDNSLHLTPVCVKFVTYVLGVFMQFICCTLGKKKHYVIRVFLKFIYVSN